MFRLITPRRFLWDAHNIEEADEQDEYDISKGYLLSWCDVVELWYLGMQVLSSVLTLVKTIARCVSLSIKTK